MTAKIVNGKRWVFPPHVRTVGDVEAFLREQARQQGRATQVGGDSMFVDTKRGVVLRPDTPLEQTGALTSLPKNIVKGAHDARIAQEVAMLRESLGAASPVKVGRRKLSDKEYTLIHVDNVGVDPKRCGVAKTAMLFLLPPSYPSVPSLGVYLPYPWKELKDRQLNFTLRAHYGEEDLQHEGWYWYCLAAGGGFHAADRAQTWTPRVPPEDGHTLITLFAAARYALQSTV